jgi:long-chain acyl-CoA synthetase
MAVIVTRTFDILERYLIDFPRKDALGGKKDGNWYTYSTEEYVEKSHQVATVTANRPEWNFADMGMAMTGIVHVPIYPTIGEDEYKYILHHAEVKVIIVGDQKLYEKINPIAKLLTHIEQVYTFEELEGAKYYEEILDLGKSKKKELESELTDLKKSIQPEDLATIIYTSGTTGVPKV